MAFGLEGIKVVQTAGGVAGPMAGRLLADWGADVIGVVNPVREGGPRSREQQRLLQGRGRRIQSDINYGAENLNRNKRGMTLDLSQEGGREILYKLLEKADVFLSNFRPREITKFKLEYDTLKQLNPRLIHANLTGYGKKGADRDHPATEATGYFARGGIFHLHPAPGSFVIGLGDNIAGQTLALGIMAALFMRERTGVGQEVDVSLFQTAVFAMSNDISGALVTGQDLGPVERKNMPNVLVNSYQTKDGRWLRLNLSQAARDWSRFCHAIEREDLEHDPRFEQVEPRVENQGTLFNILEEAFLTKTLDEWKVRLDEAGLNWAPIQNLLEVINDPQARANDFFVGYDHPTYGRIELVANPIKLSNSPETVRMPAPEFGQHTEEVLQEYGYTWEDIEKFKKQGIIA